MVCYDSRKTTYWIRNIVECNRCYWLDKTLIFGVKIGWGFLENKCLLETLVN